MLYILILTHAIFLIIGFYLAKFYFIKDSFQRGKVEGEFEKEKSIFYNNKSDNQSLTSDLISNKLELAFIKGKELGIREQKDKLSIMITSKVEVTDNFIKTTAKSGFETQVHYEGIPIGGPQYKVVESIEKFKEENLKYVIDKVNETALSVANLFIEKYSINSPLPVILKKENVERK